MRPFQITRMAYVEDLVLPPPLHDFEVCAPAANSRGWLWLTTSGTAIIYPSTLRINKVTVRFYDDGDEQPIYYSPSLDIAVYEDASWWEAWQKSSLLTPEKFDLILSWVFKNWAKARDRQLVKLDGIL